MLALLYSILIKMAILQTPSQSIQISQVGLGIQDVTIYAEADTIIFYPDFTTNKEFFWSIQDRKLVINE